MAPLSQRQILLRRRIILLAIARRRLQQRKGERRFWVHNIYKSRTTHGEFHHLFDDLRKDDDKFFEYFQMSPSTFDLLLSKVEDSLRKASIRPSISPLERLAVTLRFLATGSSFASLSFSYRMARCTISKIVRECCQVLWEKLNEDYLKFPSSPEEWQRIAQDFWDLWQWPNCLGSIDGKHCFMKKPRKSGSLYYNYKSTFR